MCIRDRQKAAWDKHDDPSIARFKKDKLTGKAVAEWKYQQYMHDYMRVIHSAKALPVNLSCLNLAMIGSDVYKRQSPFFPPGKRTSKGVRKDSSYMKRLSNQPCSPI